MDEPDARKRHVTPVPRVGGLAVGGALLSAFALMFAGGPLDASWWIYGLLAAGAFGIGLLDDLGRISTGEKLGLQVLLAGFAGVTLRWAGTGIGPFEAIAFGWLSPLMTALWVFAVMTVLNFIDGIDCITACVTCVMLGVGVGMAAGPGGGALYVLALGALCGAAFWNVTPARVFLGDAGTHLLGMLIACLPMVVRADPSVASPVPWALAAAPLLPCVIDVGLGIAQKLRRGIPVHAPHSDHVYQRLTKAGLSHTRVALHYGLLTLLGVGLVLASRTLGLMPTLLVAAAVIGLHFGGAALKTRDVPHEFGA